MNAFTPRRLLALCALGLALVVAACGGGTSQVEPFEAKRVIALGDEHSLLEPNGRKWAVNAWDTAAAALDCDAYPLWVQSVAKLYNLAFAECNPDNLSTQALMKAARQAKVADLAGQVSGLTVGTGDLFTVMAGANDVLELQRAVDESRLTRTQAIAEASARGKALAEFINGLVAKDARVIVATIYDMGSTPYGITLGGEKQALLSDLSTALNAATRVNMLNDGRYIALVLADEEQLKAMRFPAVLSLSTSTVDAVTKPACPSTTPLPDCISNAMVEGATAITWLWADDLHAGMRLQERIGALAVTRAKANPF